MKRWLSYTSVRIIYNFWLVLSSVMVVYEVGIVSFVCSGLLVRSRVIFIGEGGM